MGNLMRVGYLAVKSVLLSLTYLLSGIYDIILIQYDSTGSVRWTRQQGTSGDDRGYSVAVSGDGLVYVTGQTAGILNSQTWAGGKRH